MPLIRSGFDLLQEVAQLVCVGRWAKHVPEMLADGCEALPIKKVCLDRYRVCIPTRLRGFTMHATIPSLPETTS